MSFYKKALKITISNVHEILRKINLVNPTPPVEDQDLGNRTFLFDSIFNKTSAERQWNSNEKRGFDNASSRKMVV